ncbi:hypothetical protein LCGC14_0359190 [marine sediment metagenome]|uniref:Uncharacterized protein n=1 Tax=marine sediment metagenome TaxID=412755 RepID=A0A0F9TE65_9ZZZZ
MKAKPDKHWLRDFLWAVATDTGFSNMTAQNKKDYTNLAKGIKKKILKELKK